MQWLIDLILELIPPFPAGCVVAWYGLRPDIPDGWAACDGNNGTPDLRDRFIYGAGPGVALDEVGGTTIHQHIGDKAHHHHLETGAALNAGKFKASVTGTPHDVGVTGLTGTLPPYRGLWYIMKL